MRHLLLSLLLCAALPAGRRATVAEVRAGRRSFAGKKVRVSGFRDGEAFTTETAPADTIEWDRLLRDDIVEEVPGDSGAPPTTPLALRPQDPPCDS